ncbi:MAG: carbohydrate ABC transporter permease [Microbacterium sp.]
MTSAATTLAQAESATPMQPGGRLSRNRTRRRNAAAEDSRKINWWATVLIAVCSLTVLVPLYLAVAVALKTPEQLASGTGFEWPNPIRWENFADAWARTAFPQALLNTAIITVGAVVFTLLTSSVVAYALARNIHRPFFKGVFFYLLAALFIPFPIIMLPLVKQTALLGLDNQVGVIILYTIYGLSLNVFIYTAYIRSIPMELEEAARIDGASTWRVFRSVIFPLLMPMNATVGILTCVWAWNDFIMPLVILTDPAARTLPLAQYVFQGQFNTDYTTAFASYLMAMAPLLVVYIFSQRWVISGVMRGSAK